MLAAGIAVALAMTLTPGDTLSFSGTRARLGSEDVRMAQPARFEVGWRETRWVAGVDGRRVAAGRGPLRVRAARARDVVRADAGMAALLGHRLAALRARTPQG